MIPEGRSRWGARNQIDELARRQVATLLDDAVTAPPGTAARKVVDFRAAWLNEAAIEARGIAALRPVLDSIDRVRDKASLTRLLGRWIGADVDPLNYGRLPVVATHWAVGRARHQRRADLPRVPAAGWTRPPRP